MNSRWLWMMSTAAFVLTWFVFIPYLASQDVPGVDHFTDSKWYIKTQQEVHEGCTNMVLIMGRRIAKRGGDKEPANPYEEYKKCTIRRGGWV